MKMLSLLLLAMAVAAGSIGCGSKACCKDKSKCATCPDGQGKDCGPGCAKPCCAPQK